MSMIFILISNLTLTHDWKTVEQNSAFFEVVYAEEGGQRFPSAALQRRK